MGESLKSQKSWTFKIQILKLMLYTYKVLTISSLNGSLSKEELKIN